MTQILVLLFLGIISGLLGQAMRNHARKVRRYSQTARPTSIAAARGLVEISGLARAAAGAPTRNPITQSPCVWYCVYYESDGEIDRPDDNEKSPDPLLLDDGTGVCALELDKVGHFAEREVIEKYASGTRVLRKILAGTHLYAIGRIESLAVPDRGATHRLVSDPEIRMAVSHRSLQHMANYLPRMARISNGAFIVSGSLLLVAGVLACIEWLPHIR